MDTETKVLYLTGARKDETFSYRGFNFVKGKITLTGTVKDVEADEHYLQVMFQVSEKDPDVKPKPDPKPTPKPDPKK